MDTLSFQRAERACTIKLVLLVGVITLIVWWLLPEAEYEIKTVYLFLFIFSVLISYTSLIDFHKKYEGYGVLEDINLEIRREIGRTTEVNYFISVPHVRFAPTALISKWLLCAGISGLLFILICLLEFTSDPVQNSFDTMIWSSIGGVYCGLMCAIYRWIMVDRKRFWYLNRESFEKTLKNKVLHWEMLQLADKLTERNLLTPTV